MEVIVLGGGYAGVAAALRARRRSGGAVRVTLVNASPSLVERIRLHQAAVGQVLRERPLETLLARAGVTFVVGRVADIDVRNRSVLVDGTRLRYDRLVLALGSHPRTDGVPGAAEHAFTLAGDGTRALAQRLAHLGPRGGNVLVVGNGLCGIEVAAEVAEAYPRLDVTLAGDVPALTTWAPAAREQLRASLERLRISSRVLRIRSLQSGVARTSEGDLPCDACIWTTGFDFPRLPAHAGIDVTDAGQVRVRRSLRCVSHPEIYAVGDLAHIEGGPGVAVPLGCKSAMPMGAHVGDNLAREARGEAPLPFDFGVAFFCVSLGRREGIIQWPAPGGALRGRTWTGARAAWMKELVCKATVWALEWESRGWPGVAWRQGEGGAIATSARLARGGSGD